jgi:hypothetical protein
LIEQGAFQRSYLLTIAPFLFTRVALSGGTRPNTIPGAGPAAVTAHKVSHATRPCQARTGPRASHS